MANNPPLSFKTVPGRNRTQKWSQAKTYNYDGDDWGGYDPYDEYGSYDDDLAVPAHAPQPAHGRQNSFDRGVENETRAFSAGYAREPSPPKESDRPSTNDGRTRAREFSNPGQVPQPLQMRSSPAAAERPPRKSSLSSASAKSGTEGAGPTAAAPPSNTDKPLPFIRPSDIYKRMAEEKERERQSMESSRPSMDSVQRASESPSRGPAGKRSMESLPSSSGRRPSLEPVSEGRERMQSPLASVSERPTSGEKSFDGFKVDSPELAKALGAGVAKPEETHSPVSPIETRQSLERDDSRPQLPPMGRLSGFGSLGTGFLPSDREGSEEPASTHAPTGSDPAADILAERQQDPHVEAVGRAPHEDPSGLSGPPRTYDPAAEILNERLQDAPAQQLGRAENEDPAGLSHQPSSGFRSVVHTAFDRQDDDSVPPTPVSRDNSQNQGNTNAGVGRSDTNSTASISPIMSRVPSAATAQQRHQERNAAVPPIAEESETARSRPASGSHGVTPVSRKPVHSRNVSAEIPGFEPGYRRSLTTPSPNNSPARTPGMEDTSSRRLSGPMAAQMVASPSAEAPDVSPVAPEAPAPTLHPVDTSVSNASSPMREDVPSHAGDYTVREADLADETNSSPDKGEGSPDVAHAATLSQNAFLRSHPDLPAPSTGSGPTSPSSPGTGFAKSAAGFPRSTTPGSGRTSPMAGGGGGGNKRVRHIVDQYHQIDDEARRYSTASSKSSWSNFGASQENLTLKRRGTGGNEGEAPTSPERQRPEPAGRLESFRPHLPGEWVSYAATPAGERPPGQQVHEESGATPRVSREVTPASPPTPRPAELQRADTDEIPDLTPTTQKTQLRGSDSNAESGSGALGALKSAGDALAASLSSHSGYGHQAQDFAAPKEATPPQVDVPEMRAKPETGEVGGQNVPVLMRGDSEITTATEGTEWSGEGSVAESVPPTPPAKDTGYGLNPPLQGGGEERPVSGYFAGVQGDDMAPPAPLKLGRSSQGPVAGLRGEARPTVLPTMSTDTGVGDSESDRLRKDIVRTLSPDKKNEMARQSIVEQEDVERTQDALDAPTNERRVEQGKDALPAAETAAGGRSGLPSQMSPPASSANRPAFLTERFSWEKAPQGTGLYAPGTRAVGEDPDVDDADRRSYERPRSSQGLRIINPSAAGDESEASSKAQTPAREVEEPRAAERGLEEAILPAGTAAMALDAVAPEPVGEGEEADAERASHIPSYYGGAALSSPSTLVDPPSPHPATNETGAEGAPPTTASSSQPPPTASSATHSRIPPFREILTIKSTSERIKAYGSTRDTFAHMDTGLADWTRNMVVRNPEYANLNIASAGTAAGTGGLAHTGTGLGTLGRGHKHSASVFTKLPKLGSSTSNAPDSPSVVGTGSGQRVTSAGSSGPGSAGGLGGVGGGSVDVERMQARGKDFIKGVGGGAKGLFNKGRSRFGRGGGEKAPHPLPRSSLYAIESSFQSTPNVAHGNPTTVPPVQSVPPIQPSGLPEYPAQEVGKGKGKGKEEEKSEKGEKGDANAGPPVLVPVADVGGLATQQAPGTETDDKTELDANKQVSQEDTDTKVPITNVPSGEIERNAVAHSPATAPEPPATEAVPAQPATVPDSSTQEAHPSPRQRPSFFSRLRSASRSLASRSRPGSVVLSPSTASNIGGGETLVSRTGKSTPATPRAGSRSRSRSLSRVRDHLRSRSRAPSTSEDAEGLGKIAGAGRSGEDLVPRDGVPEVGGDVRRRSEERSRSDSRGHGKNRSRSRSLSLGRVSGGLIPGVTGGVPALPTPSVALAAKEEFLGGSVNGAGVAGEGRRREVWEEDTLDSSAGRRREAWEDGPASPRKDEEQARRLGILPSPATDAGFAPLSPERKGRERGQSVSEEVLSERRSEEILEERRSEENEGVRTRPGTPPAFVALQRAEDGERGNGAAHAEQPVSAENEGGRGIVQPTPVRPEEASQASRALNKNASLMAADGQQVPATQKNAATAEPTATPALPTEITREDSPPPSQPASFAKPLTAPNTPVRPPNQRKPSALAELPSQQRNRQLSQPASAVASPSESPLASPRRGHVTPVKYPGIPTPAMVMAGLKDRVARVQQGGAEREDDVFATPLTPSGDATVAGTGSSTPARAVSRPVSAEGDRKSVVSARDDKAQEGKKAGDAGSRRSSVSSLGSPGSHDTVVATPGASKRQSMVMTPGTQANAFMPGGFESSTPMSPSRAASMGSPAVFQSASNPGSPAQRPPNQRSLSSQSLTQEQRFAHRSYVQPQDGRPMSYMPLARDPSGMPKQEMLDRAAAEQVGHSRRPSGARTPSFGQYPSRQNSMARQPSLGSPPSEYDRLRSPQPEDSRPGTATDRRSKRFSGFLRGSQPTSITPDAGNTVLPPPSQIHENFNGLEDPEVSQLADELANVEKSDKQVKRRSGIWNAFKRTPSESLSNLSRANSSHGIPGQAMESPQPAPAPVLTPKEDNRPNKLSKLNRGTSSAATGEEPKKKRFSRLGSIFGRSNTSATKPNRLSKAPPPAQQNAQAYGAAPTGGARGGYEAYEAARRKQMPPPQYWQQQPQYMQHQAPYVPHQRYGQPQPYGQQQPYVQPRQEEVEVMMSSPYRQEPPLVSPVVSGGSPHQRSPSWSHSRHSSFSGPPGAHQQQTSSPQHSRHSSLVDPSTAYGQAPAEYYAPQAPQSPILYGPGSPQAMAPPQGAPASPQTRRLHSASYQRQDALPFTPHSYGAVGPFNNHQPASPPPQAPTGLVYENAATSRPIPSAYPRPAPRSRQSSYNNGQQHTAPDAYFHQRQASYSSQDEYPHAPPAQTYQPLQPMYYEAPQQQVQAQQQYARPTVAPVQTSGQDSGSRANSMGSIDQLMARSPARDYADQQTPYGIAMPSGENGWGPPPQQQQQQQQHQGPPRAAFGAVGQQPQGYTPGPRGQYAPPSQQRARYYDQLGQQQQQRPQHQRQYSAGGGEGQPLTFQRTPSGFTGRRDDVALGEAELMGLGMKGASYPGQEWVPGPGGRF